MNAPQIIDGDSEIDSLLDSLRLDRASLTTVAMKAAAARNESVAFDPVNAPGQLSYIYGTRALREAFVPSGEWVPDNNRNIESVFNPRLGVKVVFQNVDVACALQCPKAISAKGLASKKLVENASFALFPELERQAEALVNASVWYFCVSANGEKVRAELSRPKSIRDSDGQFDDFQERIFILNCDFPPMVVDDDSFEDGIDDIDISVTRKK